MSKLVFTALLTLTSTFLFGQTPSFDTPVGSYLDLKGQPLYGYADLDFSPDRPLVLLFKLENNPASENKSKYYTPEGVVEQGIVKFQYGMPWFTFQKGPAAKKQKINYDTGWSIKRGRDSLIVVSTFRSYSKLTQAVHTPQLLKQLVALEHFTFFQNYSAFNGDGYAVKIHASNEFVLLPKAHKVFMEVASQLFTDYPEMLELLQKKELKQTDMPQIIRYLQYAEAARDQKPLGYTHLLEMSRTPSEIKYLAQVTRENDLWRLDFTNTSGNKLFTEHYLHAAPSKRHGEYIWYYPETGTIRRKTRFHHHEESQYHIYYFPDGNPQYKTFIPVNGTPLFREVYDQTGTPLLDAKGNGTEQLLDETTGRSLHRVFKSNKLSESYYLDDQGQKIYQLADRNASIRSIKEVNMRIPLYVHYPPTEGENEIGGVVLVRVLLDTNGKPIKHELLRGITPALDRAALAILTNKHVNLSFSAAMQDGKAVYQELIVPIHFQLFTPSTNNNYYHHIPFPNPAMMPVTPPSIPRF